MSYGHKAHVLVTSIEGRHVHRVLFDLEVATAVDHLEYTITLQWCHNEPNGVSNHRRLDCLLNRLFGPRFKIKGLRHWPLWGIHRWSVNSPHKGPVTRKMFPFDDVIMKILHFIFVSAQSLNKYLKRIWFDADQVIGHYFYTYIYHVLYICFM